MSERSTVSLGHVNGISFLQYNSIVGESGSPIEFEGEVYNGFYISYNNYDVNVYGDKTTALVLGQMQKFYILNGDHREQYAKVVEQGFDECLSYYKENIKNANKYSDNINSRR